MKNRKTTQQKWAKFQTQKPQNEETVKIDQQRTLTILTHTAEDSQAEILLPEEYAAVAQQSILVFDVKQPIVVQVCKNSRSIKVDSISILRSICDMSNVVYEPGYKFKSSFRLDKPENYNVDFVELLVKDNFMSRRDQYKIQPYFCKTLVYVGKVLNFEGLKLTVMSVMSNNSILKRGVISQTTKLIYRTGNCKYTILLELSKQTFQLDINQETYVEKAVQFMSSLNSRNSVFQSTHKFDILLFGRLYYPQVHSLNEAYDLFIEELAKVQTKEYSQTYSLNFAVAFQVDQFGNVYEDVYRKVSWKKTYGNLSTYLWKKIGEFLYTINWTINMKPFAQFILKRVKQEMDKPFEESHSDNSSGSSRKGRNMSNVGDPSSRIRPFLRLLQCQLSESRHCNILEAINLVAEQYSKHYNGRNLFESGSSIVIVTPGHGNYYSDAGTFHLAKSNVNLGNISCVMVNIRNGIDKVEFMLTSQASFDQTIIDDKQEVSHLIYDCLEEYIYCSPVNQHVNYKHTYFQNRMGIRKDTSFLPVDRHNQHHFFKHIKVQNLKCKHTQHYLISNREVEITQLPKEKKEPKWIEFCNFSQDAFKCHQQLYEKIPQEIKFYETSRYNRTDPEQKLKINRIHQTFDKLRNFIKQKEECGLSNQPNRIECRLQASIKHKQSGEVYFDSKDLNSDLFKIQVGRLEQISQRTMSNSAMSSRTIEFDIAFEEPNVMNRSSMSSRTNNEQVNIFEVQNYEASRQRPNNFLKSTHRKEISHYKNRQKFNYKDSKVHSLMPNYKQPILKHFSTYLHRTQECPADIRKLFQMEYYWKMMCFPLLTPIKTAYNILDLKYILRGSRMQGVEELQEVICQKLSENYQLVETTQQTHERIQKNFHMAKGDLYCAIMVQDGVNLNIREQMIERNVQNEESNKSQQAVNMRIEKMDRQHSEMLYRYLCYEERQYRFVGRFAYFKDTSSWKKDEKAETKKFMLSFVIDSTPPGASDTEKQRLKAIYQQNFREYLQVINDKYQGQIKGFPMVVREGQPKGSSQFVKVNVTPNEIYSKQLKIYKKDKFDIYYENTWNFRNTWNIVVEWSSCMSFFIAEFVKHVLNIAKFNKKILSYLVPPNDPFNIQWTFESPAEIIFENSEAIDMLEHLMAEEWVWDRAGYYFHKKGISFIKILKEKKMLLWRDNMREVQDSNESAEANFNTFFKKAAMCDILSNILKKIQ